MKDKNLKLSIVLPVYGVEKYIEKCMDSLLVPDNDDYEIVVVNDGTMDRSIDIIREKYADSRIRIVEQTNAGLSAARNRGIQEAKGEYIWCFDSDDWAETQEIPQIIKELQGIDFLYFSSYFGYNEDNGNQTLDKRVIEAFTGSELACKPFYFCAPYYIMRRAFLLQNDLSFKVGLLHEDTLFTPIMITHAGPVKCYKTPVYHHRFRDGSITQSEVSPKRIKDLMYIIETLINYGNEAIPASMKYKWGFCIAQTVNSVLFLSQQCKDKDTISSLRRFVNKNFVLISYLKHAGFNNRVMGFLATLFFGRLFEVYSILYRLRYHNY